MGIIENYQNAVADGKDTIEAIELANKNRNDRLSSISNRINNAKSREEMMEETMEQAEKMKELLDTNFRDSTAMQEDINKTRASKQRMIEINTYYNQKYKAQINVVKTGIKTGLIVLALGFIKKLGFIPENIIVAIILVVLLVGLASVLYQLYDISIRGNMYFDEYNSMFQTTSNGMSESIWDYNKKHLFNPLAKSIEGSVEDVVESASCIGSRCCNSNDGTVWDSKTKSCVGLANVSSTTVENFGTGSGAGSDY